MESSGINAEVNRLTMQSKENTHLNEGRSSSGASVNVVLDGNAHGLGSVNKEKQIEKRIARLIEAVDNENVALVRELISTNVCVNNTDQPILESAIRTQNNAIVKALIEAKASVNSCTDDGKSLIRYAVELAVEAGNTDIVQSLKQAGAVDSIDSINKWDSSLIYCIEKQDLDVCKVFLDGGDDANVKNYKGETAIICATKKNDIDIVEALIKAGADVNVKAKDVDGKWRSAEDSAILNEEYSIAATLSARRRGLIK